MVKRNDCEVLESGEWGRCIQIFHHEFYGEGFEINPSGAYTRKPDPRPYACLVWSGNGSANGYFIFSLVFEIN